MACFEFSTISLVVVLGFLGLVGLSVGFVLEVPGRPVGFAIRLLRLPVDAVQCKDAVFKSAGSVGWWC